MENKDKNQEIKEIAENIAKKSVLAEIWEEVEFINNAINEGDSDMWDIEETFPHYPDFSEWSSKKLKKHLINELNYKSDIVKKMDRWELEETAESNFSPREIEQWWKVDSWLAEKLEEENEVIIKDFNIWGNTHSSYAMKENPVLMSIAKKIYVG
jgi:hypothetical protein